MVAWESALYFAPAPYCLGSLGQEGHATSYSWHTSLLSHYPPSDWRFPRQLASQVCKPQGDTEDHRGKPARLFAGQIRGTDARNLRYSMGDARSSVCSCLT